MDSRIAGTLYGVAIGDALGAEIEFLTLDTIRYRFPPNGPLEPPGTPAKVTDDTQLTLAVGEALTKATAPYTAENMAEALKAEFIAWFNDPDSNRAPDSACVNATENLNNGMAWAEAGDVSSKSSGANMRVASVGLIDAPQETRAALAQMQAALTHVHPTALAAADLTAFIIAELKAGTPTMMILRQAVTYARSQRDIYHQEWLGDIWQRAYMMRTSQEFIAYGWGECLEILDKVDRAQVYRNTEADPADQIGAGWNADEALGAALYCLLVFPQDPVTAVRRAAFTSGDSDTIASITGAFAGAVHGVERWPQDWLIRLEHSERITQIANDLS